jgi:hypothetical protein
VFRKLTLRERLGWWIVDRLSYWLERESDHQWAKAENR